MQYFGSPPPHLEFVHALQLCVSLYSMNTVCSVPVSINIIVL